MLRKKPGNSKKIQAAKGEDINNNQGKKLPKLIIVLLTVFLVVWIIIGFFALAIIAQGYRKGLYNGFFSSKQQDTSQQASEVQAPPKDVDLPGIGKVNVACARAALSDASLTKLAQSEDTSVLSNEEKTKFEPCIIAKASPSPSTPAASSGQGK